MESAIDKEIEAELHHFEFDPANGKVHHDVDGDLLEGWYYTFVKTKTKEPICNIRGPYRDQEEAHKACMQAWDNEDYKF